MKGEPLVILLVEDNPDHAELVARGLTDNRVAIRLRHVTDGEAALDYLYRRGEYEDPIENPVPHVILLDLRLPKMDGLEVLQKVKNDEHLRRIPVVVLTSSSAERDLTRAYDNYVNSYLVKPVDFPKFTEMMKDLGFYWLGWNRPPWGD